MAMMISKFHRLIQSKILWGIFAVVISIAMVGLFSDMPDIQRVNAEASSVGSLNGEPVQYDEFQNAYAHTRLQAALAFGQSLPRTDEVEERLRELAWKRVISLRQARKLNIQVSDKEVLTAIQQQNMFRDQNGQFDTRTYAVFLNRFLIEQMGVGQKQFEAYMREEVRLSRLQSLVAQSILIAPAELKRAFQTVTDQFTIDFIEIPDDSVPEDTASLEEAETYYNENLELFRSPEKAVVSYAEFSITDAMAQVEIEESSLLSYYNDNIENYKINEEPEEASDSPEEGPESPEGTPSEASEDATQDVGESAGETLEIAQSGETNTPIKAIANDEPDVIDLTQIASEDVAASAPVEETSVDALPTPPETPEVRYQPFEEVKDDIELTLRRAQARILAGEAATDFVLSVQDAAYQGISFADHAAKAEIVLKQTAPFARQEIPEGIDAGISFTRDAFDLGTGLTDSFSDPIDGRDTVYVLSLQNKIPSVIPPFSDLQDRAIELASRQKTADALVEFSEALKNELQDQITEEQDFSALAEEKGYSVTSLEDISASTGIPDSPYENILYRGFLSRNEGELTDLLPAGDQILLAYVRKRSPAPAQSFTDYRPRIVSNLVNERTQRIFDAFQDHLLKKASFTEKKDEEENPELESSS